MAKDDYDVLVFKILTYLYACFKRKCSFEQVVFYKTLLPGDLAPEYLTDILRCMCDEGYITGLHFVRAWGGEYVLANGPEDMRITPAGIHYLKDNSKMQKIKNAILDAAPGMLAELVKLAFPVK